VIIKATHYGGGKTVVQFHLMEKCDSLTTLPGFDFFDEEARRLLKVGEDTLLDYKLDRPIWSNSWGRVIFTVEDAP